MITIPTEYSGIVKLPQYSVKRRVSIKDSGGTWRELTNLYGLDWVSSIRISADIDQPVATADIQLISGSNTLATNPFNETSAINKLSGSYSPLVRLNADIKIEVKLVTSYEPSTWINIFEGGIDTIDVNYSNNAITLTCRDKGRLLQDTWIETERVYGTDTGTAVEGEMQKILNDNLGSGVITLYTPTSPGWNVKKWKQDRVSIMEALTNLADQIGWVIRYKWDNSTSQWRLTFYNVNRTSPSVNFTFDPLQIKNVNSLSLDIAGIRNVIQVVYYTSPTSPPQTVQISDSTSISKYGRRFMEIQEGSSSNIDTLTEATALANACLSDLKEPKAVFEVEVPLFPFVELSDYYRFTGGNNLFTSNYDLAIVSYEHVIDTDGAYTRFTCRGYPSSRFYAWHNNGTGTSAGPTLTTPATPTVASVTADEGKAIISMGTYTNVNGAGALKNFEIHASTTSGFTPDSSTLKASGLSDKFVIELDSNYTWYIKACAVDEFGNKSAYTQEYSVKPLPSTNPFGRVVYSTYFDSLDGFGIYDSSRVELTNMYVKLYTASSQYSYNYIYKNPYYKAAELSWSRKNRFRTVVKFSSYSNVEAYIGLGQTWLRTYPNGVGFRLYNSNIYGETSNGSSSTRQYLQSGTTAPILLECVFIPNNYCQFYINGTMVGSITTNLPTQGEAYLLAIYICTAENASKEIYFSEWHYISEP